MRSRKQLALLGGGIVALGIAKLPSRDAVDRLKEYWANRFDALGETLKS